MTNETRSAVALTPSEMLSTDVEVLFQDPSGIRRGAALDWVKAAPLFDATWIKKTWAELSAITTASDGQGAMVIDGDAGTHTDPVVTGTVNNAGMYIYRATGTVGWERIADTLTKTAGDAATAAQAAADEVSIGRYVYANRTGSHTNDAMSVTTDGGVVITSLSTFQLYVFNVTGPNTIGAPTLSINGLTAKIVRKASGAVLPIGYYEAGTHIAVRYDSLADEFRIIFMSPIVKTPQSPFLIFTDTSGSGKDFIGTLNPDPVDDITKLVIRHKITVAQAEGGVTYRIPQIVDEPRQLVDINDNQIPMGTWSIGDTLEFTYLASGKFELINVIQSELSQSKYEERRAFYTMRTNQIATASILA